jgi:hypothetical protein
MRHQPSEEEDAWLFCRACTCGISNIRHPDAARIRKYTSQFSELLMPFFNIGVANQRRDNRAREACNRDRRQAGHHKTMATLAKPPHPKRAPPITALRLGGGGKVLTNTAFASVASIAGIAMAAKNVLLIFILVPTLWGRWFRR